MDRERYLEIAKGWDSVAVAYHRHLSDELDRKPEDRDLVRQFVSMVEDPGKPVLDVGCGPGHISAYLAALGVDVIGLDLSPTMIDVARHAYPALEFRVGDMTELAPTPGSLGGAVALYSLINISREDAATLLRRLHAGLVPGAPLLVAVHVGRGTLEESELLGVQVQMITTLYSVEEITGYISDSGFEIGSVRKRGPYPGEIETERVYVLATSTLRP